MRMPIVLALPLLTFALTACGGEEDGDATGTAEQIPVETFEYEFVLRLEPNLQAVSYEPGPAEFVLENIGEERHELQVMRLDEGRTLEDALNYFGDEAVVRPPDWVTVEGRTSAEAGENPEAVAMELVTGRYVLACFIQTEEGASHASLGMMKTFTVV